MPSMGPSIKFPGPPCTETLCPQAESVSPDPFNRIKSPSGALLLTLLVRHAAGFEWTAVLDVEALWWSRLGPRGLPLTIKVTRGRRLGMQALTTAMLTSVAVQIAALTNVPIFHSE